MKKIELQPTRITPYISFNPDDGILEVKGRSSPENSIQFYQPLLDALDGITKNDMDSLTANFAFEYFNTSSSKCLFDIFKKLNKLEEKDVNVKVNWYYEEDDEDMMEAGEDYCDLLDLEFNFIEIED